MCGRLAIGIQVFGFLLGLLGVVTSEGAGTMAAGLLCTGFNAGCLFSSLMFIPLHLAVSRQRNEAVAGWKRALDIAEEWENDYKRQKAEQDTAGPADAGSGAQN
jgi:hypothetical protein